MTIIPDYKPLPEPLPTWHDYGQMLFEARVVGYDAVGNMCIERFRCTETRQWVPHKHVGTSSGYSARASTPFSPAVAAVGPYVIMPVWMYRKIWRQLQLPQHRESHPTANAGERS